MAHEVGTAEKAVKEISERRAERAVSVPTSDAEVRRRLRALGEPVTLFGEGTGDRRNRLSRLLAQHGDQLVQQHPQVLSHSQHGSSSVPSKELFFTEGASELTHVRRDIALNSLARAKQRLQRQKENFEHEGEVVSSSACNALLDTASTFEAMRSEVVDDRPACSVSVSPNGHHAVVASWSGCARVFDLQPFQCTSSGRMSKERLTGVCWRPNAVEAETHMGEEDPVAFAVGCADGNAGLFTALGSKRAVLSGHGDRLARVNFHPEGRLLATASFDHTWRLWDVEMEKELLAQEGHSLGVYNVRFHPDGSLACSVGLDAHGWVWDLRTGRSIWSLQGHHKQALSVDFAPNGYDIATAGEDNTVRVWDLRKKECMYVIPAHTGIISSLNFERTVGAYLVTSSYDATIRIWDPRTFKLTRLLKGHDNKVMSADVLPDGTGIVSSSYDRTIKMWTPSLV